MSIFVRLIGKAAYGWVEHAGKGPIQKWKQRWLPYSVLKELLPGQPIKAVYYVMFSKYWKGYQLSKEVRCYLGALLIQYSNAHCSRRRVPSKPQSGIAAPTPLQSRLAWKKLFLFSRLQIALKGHRCDGTETTQTALTNGPSEFLVEALKTLILLEEPVTLNVWSQYFIYVNTCFTLWTHYV